MSFRAPLSVISGLLLAGLALGGFPATSEAQFGKRLKDAVKRTAEDKAIQKATEKESEAIDDALEGDGDQPAETAAPAGSASAPAPSGATATAAPEAPAGATGAPGTAAPAERKAWANYDFVPGQRTIFYTDFTEDQVGNFPQRLEYRASCSIPASPT